MSKISNYKEYIAAIIWFMIVSIKIFMTKKPFDQFETAFVHYGIGLVLFLAFHYLLTHDKKVLIGFFKKVILMGLNALLNLLISILIIHTLQGAAPRWKELIQSIYVFGLLTCVECIVLYFVKVFEFDEFFINMLLIVGLCMCVILPARCWVSWDDQVHFSNAQLISNGFDYDADKADEDVYMTAMDGNLYKNYHKYIVKTDKDYASNLDSAFSFQHFSFQIIVAYIPAAIGSLLARGLGLPYTVAFLAGRISNFLVYALFMYMAMKCLKSGKLILALYAFIPTSVFLASNYSYDYWVNSVSAFAFCYFIGIMQDKDRKIKIKDMLIIFGCMVLAYMPKSIYFPVLLIFLFVRKDKFENDRDRKIYYLFVVASIILLICWFVLPYLFAGIGGNDTRGGENVDSSGQIHYILTNIPAYAKTLILFLRYYWSLLAAEDYFALWAYIGRIPYYKILVFIMIFAVIYDKQDCDLNFAGLIRKIAWIILALGTSALVATALYVAFTPVGADSIAGCQPRYILPLVLPTAYILGSYIIAKPFDKIRGRVINALCVSFYAGLIIYSLWAVVIVAYAV